MTFESRVLELVDSWKNFSPVKRNAVRSIDSLQGTKIRSGYSLSVFQQNGRDDQPKLSKQRTSSI